MVGKVKEKTTGYTNLCRTYKSAAAKNYFFLSTISECGGSRMEKSRMGLTMGNQKPMGNIFIVMD